MFGDRSRNRHIGERPLAVDATLERALTAVEQSIKPFLLDPAGGPREALVTALHQLDCQTYASDAFSENVIGSGAVGEVNKFSIIGEASANPIAEEVETAVFQAQIALVRAAKDAAVEQTPETISELRRVNATLTALRA
jgi:hypothetical protein